MARAIGLSCTRDASQFIGGKGPTRDRADETDRNWYLGNAAILTGRNLPLEADIFSNAAHIRFPHCQDVYSATIWMRILRQSDFETAAGSEWKRLLSDRVAGAIALREVWDRLEG